MIIYDSFKTLDLSHVINKYEFEFAGRYGSAAELKNLLLWRSLYEIEYLYHDFSAIVLNEISLDAILNKEIIAAHVCQIMK